MSPYTSDSGNLPPLHSACGFSLPSEESMTSFPTSSSYSEGLSYKLRNGSSFDSTSLQSPSLRPRRLERTPEACNDQSSDERTGSRPVQDRSVSRGLTRRNSSQIPVFRHPEGLSNDSSYLSLDRRNLLIRDGEQKRPGQVVRTLSCSYSGDIVRVDSESDSTHPTVDRPARPRKILPSFVTHRFTYSAH